MKPAWTVRTYMRSTLPLTEKVAPVVEFTFVVWGDTPPTEEVVLAFVTTHTRNVELLFSEAEHTPFDLRCLLR